MSYGKMLSKAIHIATNAHNGQFDKGGMPYILHPLRVLDLLDLSNIPDMEIREAVQCAALLHDVIEDTDTTYEFLKTEGMNDLVVKFVDNVTKYPGETLDEYKKRVFSSRGSLLVKEADLTHNSDIKRLKGVTEKDIKRMAKYHQFYLEIQVLKTTMPLDLY